MANDTAETQKLGTVARSDEKSSEQAASKEKRVPARRHFFARLRRLSPLWWSLPSLLLALLSGLYFFSMPAFTPLVTIIINIGLDPLRSQLIAALVMTAGAALIGAMVGRRRFAALLGAAAMFILNYLGDFIHAELQPFHDPGGLLEPLNMNALVRTSFIMLGLGIVCAFIGSAIGGALGEVILDPCYRLCTFLWRRFGPHAWQVKKESQVTTVTAGMPLPGSLAKVLRQWAAAALMIALLLLASSSADLFFFSPDVGLHSVPVIKATNNVPSHGTLVHDTIASEALHGQSKPFLVYLPPTYHTPQGENKYYPTLYLLHGSPGTDIDWVTGGKAVESADTLIAAHKIPELIIVFPDGNGRPKETSEWGNSGDHKQLMETYITNDLVKYVDQHYRTLPDAGDRAIGGLSMGGFGAMNIAVHHPEIFGIVISLGGYYRAEGTIWGKDPAYSHLNSPLDLLPAYKPAWKLRIYLGAATKDQPYYTYTRQFAQELDRLRIPYHFDLEQGYHSWHVWQVQMYKALMWLPWDSTTNNNRLKSTQYTP